MVYRVMPLQVASPSHGVDSSRSSVVDIFRIPSFLLLVLQGVVGGVPWSAMSFLPLYWTAIGFTNLQAGRLMLAHGFGGVFGSVFSGLLGDAAARHFPDRGRVYVALASVALGIPPFMCVFWIADADHFVVVGALLFLFHFVASWTNAAANRPICAELVRSPQDRAQIVAWWIMLEGISSSIFGAPLVGVLSERFGYRLDKGGNSVGSEAKDSLALAIVGISVTCWLLCAMAWVAMGFVLPRDRARAMCSSSGCSNDLVKCV